jgi:hypothetical protein
LLVTIANYAVGVFTYARAATALDPIVVHLNNSLVTPENPAVPGEVLVVYCTGVGKLNNAPRTGDGAPSAPLAEAADKPIVTVGGTTAGVSFAGLTPGLVGLIQINIQLAANLPSGSLPMVIQFPGDMSPSVNLAVAGNIAGAPKLSLSTSSLAFGNVTVGQSKDLPLLVSNTGTAVLSGSATITGTGFSLTGASSFSLQPGASQTVTVRFVPGGATSVGGTLRITSNDSASPASVTLSGTGVSANAPVIALSIISLEFGNVIAGQTKDLVVQVQNTGNAALTVSSVSSSNARFSLANPGTPFSVGQGSFQNITVRFAPTAAGAQTGVLTLTNNDPARPSVSVSLSGTGTTASSSDVVLKVDGGVFNSQVGYAQGSAAAYFLNRLTPPSYPATIKSVQIFFFDRNDGLPVNSQLGVISATNPSGSSTISSESAGSIDFVPATITALNALSTYGVPSRTIASGDFVVGFVVQNPQGVYPAELDRITPSQRRSYVSNGGATFTLIDSLSTDIAGNFGIRAVVTLGGANGTAAEKEVTLTAFPVTPREGGVSLPTAGAPAGTLSVRRVVP